VYGSYENNLIFVNLKSDIYWILIIKDV
jgi:hypothetical protein